MTEQQALLNYCLQLGDDALVQSYRLSEWCSNAPILEEDLALTNFALDMTGRAQALLAYAATIEGNNRTEDDLAYRRPERQYLNHLIMELPNTDFAFTIARMLFTAAYEYLLYAELTASSNEMIAAIAAKTVKEVKYHLAHARDWALRLGDGTEESHEKMQLAVNRLWAFTGELFEKGEGVDSLLNSKIAVDVAAFKERWMEMVSGVLREATIAIPTETFMQTGGLKGIHTEYLGHMLSEMQYLQRAYPDATW